MRWFVTFKQNTSHYQKVLVFQDVSRHIAWDLAVKHYGEKVDSLYSEQEFANILPLRYVCKQHWFHFMEEVTTNSDLEVSVKSITDWFKIAKPEPVTGFPPKWLPTQLGAHFEEVAECMLALIGKTTDLSELPEDNIQLKAYKATKELSDWFYKLDGVGLTKESKVELLDSLADQVVTATGVAYFSKFKFDEALTEVNKSNYSKFVQGKPVLNENGKIIKGKDYFKPELKDYV